MNPIRRTVIRGVATVAIAATAWVLLTGCSEARSDQKALLVGVRNNTAAVPEALVREAMQGIDANGDRVSVVSTEGVPRVLLDLTLSGVPTNSLDKKDYLDDVMKVVLAAVAKSEAVTPEADQTEAFSLAAETFSDDAGSKTIVALDSLIATTGGYAMTDGRLYDDASDRAKALDDAGGIPDLTGVKVEVPRLGVVVAPQEALGTDARSNLQAQWKAFFDLANATVSFDSMSLVATAQAANGLPAVTPVPIERIAPTMSHCRSALPGRSVGFIADSADFIDPAAAKATIDKLAVALEGCEGGVLAEGSTSAAAGQDESLPLSQARAMTVAVALAAAMGISVDDIRIIGYGREWPCRVPDLDSEGRLIESAAAENRVVVISRGATPGTC